MSKINCWEYKGCGRQPGGANVKTLGVCPVATQTEAHGINGGINGGRACWAIEGTLCGGRVQGTYVQKLGNCMECDFYNKVREDEGAGYRGTKDIACKLKASRRPESGGTPQLIAELKREHNAIIAALNEVKRAGIGKKAGQDLLISTKQTILAHLKKEDERVYSLLNSAAVQDADLNETLEFYAASMKDITGTVLEFYEKYSQGGSGFEFEKDFGRLCAKLSLRITKEENVIYKKLDELNR